MRSKHMLSGLVTGSVALVSALVLYICMKGNTCEDSVFVHDKRKSRCLCDVA